MGFPFSTNIVSITESRERRALVVKPIAESCVHSDTELVGFDGAAKFVRCVACNEILVAQSGRVWAIRPMPKAAIPIR